MQHFLLLHQREDWLRPIFWGSLGQGSPCVTLYYPLIRQLSAHPYLSFREIENQQRLQGPI